MIKHDFPVPESLVPLRTAAELSQTRFWLDPTPEHAEEACTIAEGLFKRMVQMDAMPQDLATFGAKLVRLIMQRRLTGETDFEALLNYAYSVIGTPPK